MHTKTQSTLKGVSVGIAEASLGGGSAAQCILQQPQQGNPSPIKQNSFRGHSPLPILISLPLAKESPQFPLPPKSCSTFFFFEVVNYNSRAKSTINFNSYLNNLMFCTVLFLLSSSPRHTAFVFLLYLALPQFSSFSANDTLYTLCKKIA